MKPIFFKGHNTVIGKDQPEYLPLPAHYNEEGDVRTVWKFSIRERLKILFGGKIELTQMTFLNPLQPIRASVVRISEDKTVKDDK